MLIPKKNKLKLNSTVGSVETFFRNKFNTTLVIITFLKHAQFTFLYT